MSNVSNKFQKNIILFDLSNLIFYRYYSIQKYFNFKQKELHTEEFKNKFLDFDSILYKISKKLNIKDIINNENIYYLKDCKRSDIWRHKYVENYKGNRKHNPEIKEYFTLAISKYFYNKNIIEENFLEADDICAIFVNYIIHNNIKYDNMYIFTSDIDYLQLKYNNNIHIYDMKLSNLSNKSLGDYKKDLIYKCIMGDKSDNIKPVFNRINKKLLMTYINEHHTFMDYLDKNPDIKKKYDLNCLLIDLNNVPDKLKNNVINKIKLLNHF